MNEKQNRRHFIKLAGLGLASTTYATAHGMESVTWSAPLEEGKVILFQGDSITDGRRERSAYYPNQSTGLGHGYVFLAAASLLKQYSDHSLKVYNRGISGHKVFQLANRWNDDCLNLKPDVLSILIGVNDYWHMINGQYDGDLKTYENDYRALLKRTKDHLPDLQLIIGEPFAVKGGSAIDPKKWFPKFDGYRAVAKQLSEEFGAAFIPYQQIFDEAIQEGGAAYWCPDGVHPSLAGAQLMADHWLKAIKL